jgi:hypothetical protein
MNSSFDNGWNRRKLIAKNIPLIIERSISYYLGLTVYSVPQNCRPIIRKSIMMFTSI